MQEGEFFQVIMVGIPVVFTMFKVATCERDLANMGRLVIHMLLVISVVCLITRFLVLHITLLSTKVAACLINTMKKLWELNLFKDVLF